MYVFKHVMYGDDGEIVMTLNNQDLSWPDLLDYFQDFLLACGYVYDKAQLSFGGICKEEHERIIQEKYANKKEEDYVEE